MARKLRQDRPIAELDQGVDDRGGVKDHAHLVVGDAEEVVSLDHFERLVHHRGGVDRDPRPHRPRGVLEGVLGRDAGELVRVGVPERPSRRREEDAPHVLAPPGLQALEHGAVLAVDGDEMTAALAERVAHQAPSDDEALLVGQGDNPAAGHPGERRQEADGPDEGVDDDVRIVRRSEFRGPTLSTENSHVGKTSLQPLGVGLRGDRDDGGPDAFDLPLEEFDVRTGGQADDSQGFSRGAKPLYDVECLRPDRSGGPQNDDVSRGLRHPTAGEGSSRVRNPVNSSPEISSRERTSAASLSSASR